MKKILLIALAPLTAAITVISCSKEEMQSSSVSEGTVLTASIAQSPDTKTGMSGATEGSSVSIVWSAGDKLSVLSGASYGTNNEFTLKDSDAGQKSGSFTGTEISGDIIAVYPYASDVAYSAGKVTLNIPETQAYTDATFAQNSVPMVAKGTVENSLSFNYLFSAIAFKVNGSGKEVTKVTVAATTPLWGPAEISDLDGTPVITMTGTDKKYYTSELTCATAQDISSDKVFYIAVPAGTYCFAVNVYCGSEVFHESYTTEKTFTIGKIKYNATAKSFIANGPAYVEGSYIGEGIQNSGIYWAPVNCGFDEESAPMGLLYQWDRKYGQSTESLVGNFIAVQASSKADGNTFDNSGKFYKVRYCWFSGYTTEDTWDAEYDPCPAGWRVPTVDEMGELVYSNWDSEKHKGTKKNSYSFDQTTGTATVNGLAFCAAGYRDPENGSVNSISSHGEYFSSSSSETTAYSARVLRLTENSSNVGTNNRSYGLSVRCVQE